MFRKKVVRIEPPIYNRKNEKKEHTSNYRRRGKKGVNSLVTHLQGGKDRSYFKGKKEGG